MKKLAVVLVAMVAFNFTLPDTTLTSAERNHAIDLLKGTKEAFLKSIKGLSEKQLSFKASPTSWSITECAEHIAITEGGIFSMVDGSLKTAADASKRSDVKMTDDAVVKLITDRSHKIKTQEQLEPKNNFGSLEGSVKEFTTKRDAHIEFVKNTKEDLRDRYQVMQFGTIDQYQVILFMAGHTKRHTEQIEEVKKDPNYPK